MNLLLTSAGLRCNALRESLKNLVKEDVIKTAFIPTAANGEVGDKSWLIDDLLEFRKLGEIDIVNIELYSEEEILEKLGKANVIVFGGGNTQYLIKKVFEKNLHIHLKDLLNTRVYVGISAGSIITGDDIQTSSDYLFHESYQEKIHKGLGFTGTHIIPHLNSPFFINTREENLQKILGDKPSSTFLALDDMSGLEVVNGKERIVSEGNFKFFGK